MSVLYPDLDLTSFPENIDAFKKWLDVTAQDGPLIKQYMDAMNAGDKAKADQILSQIPSATEKIIKATDLNKITQAVLAVERFYSTDVKGYIENKEAQWANKVDQLNYRGDWSSGTVYVKDNFVTYTIFGIKYVYIATVENVPIGMAPTDNRYWRKLTIQGIQGESGVGASYREYWEASDQYSVNDMVTHEGALWIAVKPSQGIVPTQQSDAWKLVMTLAAVAYPIQPNQPVNQDAGDIWFNTSENPTKFYYLEELNSPATEDDITLGKEAYNQNGEIIVGRGQIGGIIEWNSDTSPLQWTQ